MLQILTSGALSKDLKPWLAPGEPDECALRWFGHRVTVNSRKCVVMMDAASRYGILIAGLTKKEFSRFPELFRERLARELVMLHDRNPEIAGQLESAVEAACEPVSMHAGSDRSVQSHINEFVWHVRWWVERAGRLPESDEQMFEMGLTVNGMLKKSKHRQEYFVAREEFRAFWLEKAGIDAAGLPGIDDKSPLDPDWKGPESHVTRAFKDLSTEECGELLSDPWRFSGWLEKVEMDGFHQFRHILRYLLFPDSHEAIASSRNKWQIASRLIGTRMAKVKRWSDSEIDRKLLELRRQQNTGRLRATSGHPGLPSS